jgi:hypothetical protein
MCVYNYPHVSLRKSNDAMMIIVNLSSYLLKFRHPRFDLNVYIIGRYMHISLCLHLCVSSFMSTHESIEKYNYLSISKFYLDLCKYSIGDRSVYIYIFIYIYMNIWFG